MAQNNAKQVESTEHAPGKSGPFPPFDKETFPSQVLWLALAFIALYLLISRIALPRIGSILEARSKQIEADFNEAERLRVESDETSAAYERALAEARGRAQALDNEAREQAAAEAKELRKKLDAALNVRISEAEKAIATKRSAAMTNVESIATETARAIVERLTGVTPTTGEVSDAVTKALKR